MSYWQHQLEKEELRSNQSSLKLTDSEGVVNQTIENGEKLRACSYYPFALAADQDCGGNQQVRSSPDPRERPMKNDRRSERKGLRLWASHGGLLECRPCLKEMAQLYL